MKEKTKPRIKKQNRKKGLLSLIAASLALLTLSSCATTYSAKINGGDGSGEWLPPVSLDEGTDSGKNDSAGGDDLADFFDKFGDFDPTHLFSQSGFDASALAGLAGLAGLSGIEKLAEQLKDYSGFTKDDAYFIADFDNNPSKYSGAGKFLFAKNRLLSQEQAQALLAELTPQDAILAGYATDDAGVPRELYTVYPLEEGLKQIYIVRKNEQTGKDEVFVYDYVTTPIDGQLPAVPGEQIPDLSGVEQGERYSTEWLEWLIYKDKGQIYNMVEGTLYKSLYENDARYTSSPWSIRLDGIVARFALSLGLDPKEVPYVDEGGEKYRWRVFYREGNGEFLATTPSFPWLVEDLGGMNRFELDLFNYGMIMELGAGGTNTGYETVFIIEDQQGRILCWCSEVVDWTDSSEAYYKDAVLSGIQQDYRGTLPDLPEREPINPFSSEWVDWLVNTDNGESYDRVELYPRENAFEQGLTPSPFVIWPYDSVTGSAYTNSRFGMALSIDHNRWDFTENLGKSSYPFRWTFAYRAEGEEQFVFGATTASACAPYGYAVYGNTCLYYLNLLDYGFTPILQKDGSPTRYEIVFIIRDRNDSSNVVGWQRTVVEWNDSAIAYYEKAVDLGIQKDVLKNLREPSNKTSSAWAEWLVADDGQTYTKYEQLSFIQHVYLEEMSRSAFYAQDGEFRLSFSLLAPQTQMTHYGIFYRPDSSNAPYEYIEAAVKTQTDVTLYEGTKEDKKSYSIDVLLDPAKKQFTKNKIYRMILVCYDGETITGYASGTVHYNSTSELFRTDLMGTSSEPDNKTSSEWVRWLENTMPKAYPAFSATVFGDGGVSAFSEVSSQLQLNVYLQAKKGMAASSFRVFLRLKDTTAGYTRFEANVGSLKTSALIDPDQSAYSVGLIVDASKQYFTLLDREYEIVLVALDEQDEVIGWGSGILFYSGADEACRKRVMSYAGEPENKTSKEWADWLVNSPQVSSVYAPFRSFEASAYSYEPGMEASPFRIKQDLTSELMVMEFIAELENQAVLPDTFTLVYKDVDSWNRYYYRDFIYVETQKLSDGRVRYQLAYNPKKSIFSLGQQQTNEYDVVLLAKVSGKIVGWHRFTLLWNESAECYRVLAEQTGAYYPEVDATIMGTEPSKTYSAAWVSWIKGLNTENAPYKKVDFAPYKPNNTLSSFFVYPTGQDGALSTDSFFAIAVKYTPTADIDLLKGLLVGNKDSSYKWRLFYRVRGSYGGYAVAELQPSQIGSREGIIFFDIGKADPAFRFPVEEIQGYEMVLVVSDAATDKPLYYGSFNVAWNALCEAEYQLAKEQGLLPRDED